MEDIVIKAEELGKKYILNHKSERVAYNTIRDVFTEQAKYYLNKGKNLFKETAINDIDEEFWALKRIDFSITKGDCVGVIGRNGAGKSTLLKILSRITEPSVGRLEIKGRVASLLEVGTGFHPELSGRDNIYLNGAILGMKRTEIKRKFDEIVEFAEVERFLDTPVKRYSSGMYVRLAFSVAAHLEPEILVVDEVLAVGDAAFQKKCLGKMDEVSKSEGRTILFVSHNMAAVKTLCTTGILLNRGEMEFRGSITDTMTKYLSAPTSISSITDFLNDSRSRRGNGEVRFKEITINNNESSTIDPSIDTKLRFSIIVLKEVKSIFFSFKVFGPFDQTPITSGNLTEIANGTVKKGSQIEFELVIQKNTFRPGVFPLYLWLGKKGELASENYMYDCIDSIFNLNYSTQKEDLGYNPLDPNGFVDINFRIADCQIS